MGRASAFNKRLGIFLGLCLLALFQTTEAGRAAAAEKSADTPRRIVSLAPNLTEILFALGLDREIVGVTRYCDFPPEARNKPRVGGVLNPSLESVLRMEPDRVFAVSGFTPPEFIASLKRLGVPVTELDFRSFDDIAREALAVGRLTGRETAARHLAEKMEARVRALEHRLPPGVRKPRVLYILSEDPLMSVGPGSFIHELIGKAGGVNVMGDAPMAYPLINMEEVLARNPEVILFSSEMGEDLRKVISRWGRWKGVAAVTSGRLYPVEADLLNRPGPRIVDGLELLTRIFHDRTLDP